MLSSCITLCCAVLQLVAVACLYLGTKVQESPKYLRDVIKAAETRKWAKWCDDHPTERRKWEDMVRARGAMPCLGARSSWVCVPRGDVPRVDMMRCQHKAP